MNSTRVITLLIAIVFCLLGGSCRTENPTLATGSIEKNFPGSIEWLRKGRHEVRFCPDNTCDVISGKSDISDESMAAFVFMYTYFFSDYFVLTKWRKLERTQEQLKRAELQLYSEVPGFTCSSLNCSREVMVLVAKKRGITVHRGRFDENKFVTEPVDLAKAAMVQ